MDRRQAEPQGPHRSPEPQAMAFSSQELNVTPRHEDTNGLSFYLLDRNYVSRTHYHYVGLRKS